MHPFFADYFWKRGRPHGLGRGEGAEVSYRVVTDPYRKRYTIERYHWGRFKDLIYDSALLDFRKLTPHEQIGWERELSFEDAEKAVFWIRNGDDRVILKEELFEKECRIYCPRGHLIAVQKGDPAHGVILFDSNEHPVWEQKRGEKKLLSPHV